MPRRLTLGASASPTRDGALAVTPRPSDGVAYWQPLGGDAFRIVWLDGGSGAAIRLSARASELRGTATPMIGDASLPARTAIARRVACNRP